MRISGNFQVSLNPAEPIGDFGQMIIEKLYTGDFVGSGMGHMLSFRTPVEGSAGYVALETVSGSFGGKSGKFVLQHSGHSALGDARLDLDIVADSGTEGFSGISGTGEIHREDNGAHRYVFDVTFKD